VVFLDFWLAVRQGQSWAESSVPLSEKRLRIEPDNLAVISQPGVWLDLIGRQFLSTMDARLCGILILVLMGLFSAYRKLRYRSWPGHQDYIIFVLSLGAMFGAVTVLVVFLLTKPPAIDLLSTQTLVLIGLLVPIIIFGNAYPKLRALLFPPRAPSPPVTAKCVEAKSDQDSVARIEN
jgi:ABC-type glycerol-3-phosphate transport system permease component